MFWGLIMEPNKRYTQVVEKAFHLSMASLDACTVSGALVQVMVCYDNRNYLLCTLQKGSIWQVPLDLNFEEGNKISFTCNGEGHVHLTGYLIPEEDGNLDELDYDDEDEDEDEEEEEEIPTLVGQKKRKAVNSPKGKNVQKPAKKSKIAEEDDDDDESDSDNEDGIGFTLEDNSDDDLDGEEEDDDDEENESDDEDEEEEEKEPQQVSKKQKQKQNQLNQQNKQQQSKKEKNKMVNGKDAKPEKEQGKQKKNKDDSKSEDLSEPQQKKRVVEGGVQVEDMKVGTGAPAKPGKFVSVHYVGKLKNGKKFDQTQQGEGFKFRLGKQEVIKGWDVGIVGMKVGGKRRIVIPPNMAYGAKGSPPYIPPNSSLIFEVELKAVH